MAWRKTNTWRYTGGEAPAAIPYTEAASQTFKAGDPLTLSSGKVAVAVAANATYASGDLESAKVIGFALKDASGATDAPIMVSPLRDDVEWLVPVAHGTPASAVIAQANVGAGFDLGHWTDGSGVTAWGVTLDDTSVKNVIVTALKDPVGTQYGEVWVRFSNVADINRTAP